MSTRISRATRNAIFKAAESGNLEEMNNFLDEFGNTKVNVGHRSDRVFNIDYDGALIKEEVESRPDYPGSKRRYDATIYVRLTPL